MSQKKFIPSILISELFHSHLDKNDFLIKLLENIVNDEYYGAVEIASVKTSEHRKKIRNLITQSGLILTQWVTDVITEENLDLSSPHTKDRKKAVSKLKEKIYTAKECGAENMAVISGPFWGEKYIKHSTKGLSESLIELCEEAKKYNIKILIEPLDRHAHKKKFMGPSTELLHIIKSVHKYQKNIGIAFDTAHAALNKENIKNSVEKLEPFIDQIHLSNAVLNPSDPLFGDNHMPVGKPGFLYEDTILDFTKKLTDLELIGERQIRLSVEVRTPAEDDAFEMEKTTKKILNLIKNTL